MLTLTKKGKKLNIQEMIGTRGGADCGIMACALCDYENDIDLQISWAEWRSS